MKKHSTRRALLLSCLSLLLCVSMLVGSTFAWFTDHVISANNVIKSGSLDIEVQYTLDGDNWADLSGADNLFQKDLWEPGHTEVVALKIINKGSLAFKYVTNMNIVSEIVGKNQQGGDIVLSDILTVSTLTAATEATVKTAFQSENAVAWGAATAFKSANVLQSEKYMLPEETQYLLVKVDMAETVGNEANHDGVNQPSITFGLNLLATQYTYEGDTFGPDYDKDATYPAIASGESDGTEDVVLNAGEVTVTVPANAGAGNYVLKVEGKNTETDSNGNTTVTYEIKLLKNGVPVTAVAGVKYGVNIEIGQELQVSTVTHSGVALADGDYTYDAVAGTVNFYTDSFSPFAVTYTKVPAGGVKVVQAGSIAYYPTLKEAVAAVTGDATITVRSDAALDETVVFQQDANITLDLGGYTVSGNNVATMLKLADGNVTVCNGVIRNVDAATTEAKYGIYMTGDAVAKIENVEIVTTGVGVYMDENAHITELNADISSYVEYVERVAYAFHAVEMLDNAKIDLISGGTYKSYMAESMFVAKRSGKSISSVPSWTFHLNSSGAYIGQISGGTFIGTMDSGNNGTPIHVNNGTVDEISGGYFGFTELAFQHPAYMLYANTANGGKINKITGGTFEEGCKPVNIPRYTGYGCDFLNIVDASGCKVESTGETVVRGAQWSSRVDSYDIQIVRVVSK